MYDPSLLRLIFELTGLPVTLYELSGTEICHFCDASRTKNPTEQQLFSRARQILMDKSSCFLSLREDLPLGICGFRSSDQYCIFGPLAYGKTNTLECRNFMRSHNIDTCPPCPPEILHSIARFLNPPENGSHSDFPPQSAMPVEEDISSTAYHDWITKESLRQYDFFQKNHTYQEEKELYDHVRGGDVSFMKHWGHTDFPSHPVLIDNLFKNEEYMAVIGISMAARAAIEGGLSSAEGFLNNDILLKKLAACRSISEIKELQSQGILHLTELVARSRSQTSSNLHVEKCKKLIISRRFEEISITDLAEELGISSEYLQKLFKKHEGISISSYIQQVKMDMACNLLKYSDRQIQEIAQYLHYSNVSHFSTAFRKYMHQSPREYREKNQHPQF